MHGEFWVNHHLRYINDLWNVWKEKRIFHVASMYGCHLNRLNRQLCQSYDYPMLHFLQNFLPANPHTTVFFLSDHGYHWVENEFNDFVAGEFEHRNPVLWLVHPLQDTNNTKKW